MRLVQSSIRGRQSGEVSTIFEEGKAEQLRTEVSSIIEKGKAEQLRNIIQSLRSGRQSR